MATVQISKDKIKELTRKALGMAIAKNRAKVIALLKKYGIAIDKSYSDDELIVGVLQAVRSDRNGRFKKDLADLLGETAKMNFTAEEGQEFFNADGTDPWASITNSYAANNPGTALSTGSVANLSGTTTAPTIKTKTALGGALSSNLGNIFSSGLSVLSTSLTNKSNQKLADTALQIEAEKTKQAALLASGAGSGGKAPSSGLSTGAKIAIGVGVAAVVGVIIYFVFKK